MQKNIEWHKTKLIDLTHSLSSNIPFWDGSCGFNLDQKSSDDGLKDGINFTLQSFNMAGGIGTHIDAPLHCIEKGAAIDQIDLAQLFVPCVVIDVSKKAHTNYLVSPEDIKTFENQYGKITKNSLVFFRTGWERFWYQPKQYHNEWIFPSLARSTAEILLERGIVGIGIDTLSPDTLASGFPVHQLILGTGKYIIENVANLAKMPPINAWCIALPIKVENGSESPARVVGLIAKK